MGADNWTLRLGYGMALSDAERREDAVRELRAAHRACPDTSWKARIARMLQALGSGVPD